MFEFKKFTIKQDKAAMKVGTDGVLLGAWANGGTRILDVGTGTGLIAIMMAQRFPEAAIDAIDINDSACQQAIENVADSPYSERIKVFHQSLQDFRTEKKPMHGDSKTTYDCIVSNPPFFQNSLKPKDSDRTNARHTDTLPFRELLRHAYRLLTENGRFSIICPYDTLQEVESEAIIIGLSTNRVLLINTKSNKKPKRVLVEFRKKFIHSPERAEVVMMDDDGARSEWYKELTKDFYIK